MADEKYEIEAEITVDEAQVIAAMSVLTKHFTDKAVLGLDTSQAIRDWEKLQEILAKKAKEREAKLPATSPLPASPSNSPPKTDDALTKAFIANQKTKIDVLTRELAKKLENVPAGVDGAELRKDITEKIKAAQDSLKVTIPVDPKELEEWRDKVRSTVSDLDGTRLRFDVDAPTAPVAARLTAFTERPRSIVIDPKLNNRGLALIGTQLAALSGGRSAADGVKKLGTELGNLDRSLPKIAGVTAGIATIGFSGLNATAGVATLVTGLSQLAGVAGLIPALAGAAGVSIGTMLASFKGVGTALGALSKAQEAAGTATDPRVAAIQAEQSAKAVSDAQRSKAEAIAAADQDIIESQKGVTDAIHEETEARKENTAQLAVAQAAQTKLANKAKQDARALQVAMSNGVSGSALQALKDNAQESSAALQAQAVETGRLAAQEAKNQSVAVSGSERVLKAQETLQKAQEDRVKAEVRGTEQVEAALKSQELQQLQNQAAANAAGNAADEAMKKLTPSAQAAVLMLMQVGKELHGIQQIAQENFFDGFAGPLRSMADVLLPQLRVGVAGLATSMGDGMELAMGSLEKHLGGGVLERMFGNTTEANDILNTAIDPIIGALMQIGDVGSSFLPQLAQGFADIAKQFGDFVGQAAADGSLHAWIQGGIDGVKTLGDILGSIFGILGAIGDAASAANGNGLTALADTLGKVEGIMKGAEFQTALTTMFNAANLFFGEVSKAIGPIGDMFVKLAPTLETIAPLLGGAIATALTAIATLISDPAFQAGLVSLSEGLLAGVQALAPAMAPLASLFGAVMGIVGQLASVLGPVLGTMIGALAPVFTQLLDALSPLISALGDGLLSILGAIMPLINLLLPVLVHFIAFLAAPDGLIAFVAFTLTQLFRLLDPQTYVRGFEALMGLFGGFGEWFSGFFIDITNGWMEFIDGIPDWFVEITNGFMNGIDSIIESVKGFGKTILDAIVSGFVGGADFVGDAFGEVIGGILPFLPHSRAKKGPLKEGWDEVTDAPKAIVTELARSTRASLPILEEVSAEVAGVMGSFATLDYASDAKTNAAIRSGASGAGVTVQKTFAPTVVQHHDPSTIVENLKTTYRNDDL